MSESTPSEKAHINEFQYPAEYFYAQVLFAHKWAELMGGSFGDAVFEKTALLQKVAGNSSEAALTEAKEEVGELINGNNLFQMANRLYTLNRFTTGGRFTPAHLYLHTPTERQFGLSTYDYLPNNPKNKGKNTIKVHFLKGRRGDKSDFDADFLSERQQNVRKMFSLIQRVHPDAEEVVGASWLYNLPNYRQTYPPEFTESLQILVPSEFRDQIPNSVPNLSFKGDSLWGQFINRYGWVHEKDYQAFLDNLRKAETGVDLIQAFPNQVLLAQTPIEVFYNWNPES